MSIHYIDLCQVGGFMYALVQRYSGVALEKFDPAYFTDSGKKGGDVASVVSGLDHLKGRSCKVRILRGPVDALDDDNGETLDDVTVDEDGEATLTVAGVLFDDCYEAEIGLPFTATVEPVPPKIGPKTRLIAVTLDLFETREINVAGFPLVTRLSSDPLDVPLPLVSGFYKVPLSGWGESKTVAITQDAPQPMTLRGWETESA